MGSNMAEAHPVGFQWVMEAKLRGARVIHVDPRYTRTSALADTYVQLRAGSDVVFLGGIVNHILSNELFFRDYVLPYTNAATIVSEDFQDTEDLDGLFSGYNPDKAVYDPTSWHYEGMEPHKGGHEASEEAREVAAGLQHESGGPALAHGAPPRDETLQHPRCVYQILKRHFARYTPEVVEEICGIPREQFLYVAETWAAASGRDRTAAVVYAVGWTQHTVGVQFIRTAAIIQLLLGNMGRPGGGIMAMRGHASIQGSTDVPTLFNLLPGYLAMPTAAKCSSLDTWITSLRGENQKGFWRNADAYAVSLLKEYFGDNATSENDYCYDHLPRLTGDHGTYRTTMDMIDGLVKGFFLLGQNPAVGSVHGRLQRLAMANLDWLVVRDLAMIESATFWKDSPEVDTGEIVPEECRTEVFFFPAASHVEKEGTFTQTERMLQWRERAVAPVDDQRSDLWFTYHLGRIIRERLADSADERDLPILELSWDLPVHGDPEWGEPDAEEVLRRINGYHLDTGELVADYRHLKADGSTSSGCWIYAGVFKGGVNLSARRGDGPDGKWGWCWPLDRRVLYNRASADLDGKPWSERKKLVWWDDDARRWVGDDIPDFPDDLPPDHVPPPDAVGAAALRGDDAFVLQADGKAWLFAPNGVVDGPLPTHYEPDESPVRNPLRGPRASPTRRRYQHPDNPANPVPGTVFPFVLTSSRLTEHYTSGAMTRTLPFLAELQPELFVEVSPQLAAERGLVHGQWCHVVTTRTAVQARAVVTERIPPLRVRGEVVHQVWMPYHFGRRGLARGDVMNDLLGIVADPNVGIQEGKVATCDVRPGPRPTGQALLDYVADYRRRAGIA